MKAKPRVSGKKGSAGKRKPGAGLKIALFDSDTQEDFISPKGALYIKGSEKLAGNFRKLVKAALRKKIPIFGAMDTHFGDEAHRAREGRELKKWGGPFPDHCVKGTWGHGKIRETRIASSAFLPDTKKLGARETSRLAGKKAVYFEKIVYSCFDNPNAKPLLGKFGLIIVFGVATDYCVKATALGLRKMGKRVAVVSDAIAAVTDKEGKKAIHEMKKAGVEFASTNEVIALFF